MSANDDALTALTSAVGDNTTATNAAVAAFGSASGGSDDISAGVNAQVAQVQANTTALNNAVTPPAAPAPDGTAATQPTNEAGTVLPPQ